VNFVLFTLPVPCPHSQKLITALYTDVYTMIRLKLTDNNTLDNNNKGTRGHTLKLSKMRCTRDCRKYFFSNRVVMLDQQIAGATGLNAFKNRLDAIRKTKMGFFMY